MKCIAQTGGGGGEGRGVGGRQAKRAYAHGLPEYAICTSKLAIAFSSACRSVTNPSRSLCARRVWSPNHTRTCFDRACH